VLIRQDRLIRRRESGKADNGGNDEFGGGVCRHTHCAVFAADDFDGQIGATLAQNLSGGVIRDGRDLRAKAANLRFQHIDVALRRQADDLEACGKLRHDIKRVRANRAGRA